MPNTLDIAGRAIGPGYPCFIIAEAGVNHNGDMELARRLVDAAASAGADAVKFQTFQAQRLVTADAPQAEYQQRNTGKAESQLAMLCRLELTPVMHRELIAYCRNLGILFLSTPFDETSADLLHDLGLPALKIPSGEITNLPYLEHIAHKGKPVILSTGMATLQEVSDAVAVIRAAGNPPLALLHCVSSYPAEPATVNLRAMKTLEDAFSVPVGYSDHTLGNEVAFAAVALGACIIEKHFTLDRTLPGPDHRASAEPSELKALVEGIRRIELSLGMGAKVPDASESGTAAVARKSLVAAVDISAGTVLTEAMIAIKRPGTGLSPSMRPQLVGRRAKQAIAADTVLSFEVVG